MAGLRAPKWRANVSEAGPEQTAAVMGLPQPETARARFEALGSRWRLGVILVALAVAIGGTIVFRSLGGQADAVALQAQAQQQQLRALDVRAAAQRLTAAPNGPDAQADVVSMSRNLDELSLGHALTVDGPGSGRLERGQIEAAEREHTELQAVARDLLAVVNGTTGTDNAAYSALQRRITAAEVRYRAVLGEIATTVKADATSRVANTQRLTASLTVFLLISIAAISRFLIKPTAEAYAERVETEAQQASSYRAQSEGQLELLARYDHLTGLANRILFRDRLEHAIEKAERAQTRVAVMFLDLDKFKDINDQFGHDAGDQLLVEVASRVSSCARRADTVARLGGDEFTVLLEGLEGPDGAATVAQKILDVMRPSFELGHRQVKMGVSIGIAIYPDDATTAEDLLRDADSAMYQAKGAGRGTFQFSTPELRATNIARLEIISDLRRDIADGRLRLVYQPQINVASGETIGVEAFVRWIRTDGEEMSAGEFITIAEDTDLMVPLGEWVLAEACRQQVAWERSGLGSLSVAVNVSPRQFRQPNLANMVAAIVSTSGIDPANLELEVTEDTLVQDAETSSVTLRLLKGIGVRVVIDDFGTGYSSLSYLKKFPIDALKIDRSFIEEVGVINSEENVVPAAVAGLARHLGIRTIAEGIERNEQLEFLQRIRCDVAQGYLIAKPMEADEIGPYLRRSRVTTLDAARRRIRGDGAS